MGKVTKATLNYEIFQGGDLHRKNVFKFLILQ